MYSSILICAGAKVGSILEGAHAIMWLLGHQTMNMKRQRTWAVVLRQVAHSTSCSFDRRGLHSPQSRQVQASAHSQIEAPLQAIKVSLSDQSDWPKSESSEALSWVI